MLAVAAMGAEMMSKLAGRPNNAMTVETEFTNLSLVRLKVGELTDAESTPANLATMLVKGEIAMGALEEVFTANNSTGTALGPS